MAYVYNSVDLLQSQPLVGDGECVTLVRRYAHLGPTATWRAGKKVWGDKSIPRGTAIATFLMVGGLSVARATMLHFTWIRMSTGSGLWTNGEPWSKLKSIR